MKCAHPLCEHDVRKGHLFCTGHVRHRHVRGGWVVVWLVAGSVLFGAILGWLLGML